MMGNYKIKVNNEAESKQVVAALRGALKNG